MVQAKVITVETSPFEGQKPGTSGLRKPVATFMQPRYTENFVQAILDVALAGKPSPKEVTLVVGGDGRYFSKPAIEAIIGIAAGNGVSGLWSGPFSVLLTPFLENRLAACWSPRTASCRRRRLVR